MSLRDRILVRGGKWGVRSLRLALASADTDHDGFVNDTQLQQSLQLYGLSNISVADIRTCQKAWKGDCDCHNVFEIMQWCHGPVSREFLQTICLAFNKVCGEFRSIHGAQAGSAPTVSFLCQEANLQLHPDIQANLTPLREGLFCFYCLWGLGLESPVSQDIFIQFNVDLCCGLSGESKLQFAHSLWGLSKDEPSGSTSKELVALAPDKCASDKIFHSIDANRNGMLSLAELDLAVIRLWPAMNNKAAIMRAYKLADTNRNGTLNKAEFFSFLHYLAAYNQLLAQFKSIDANSDGKISFQELRAKKKSLGLGDVGDTELREVFRAMDANNGGAVLFEEFAMFMAKRNGDKAMSLSTNEFAAK